MDKNQKGAGSQDPPFESLNNGKLMVNGSRNSINNG